MAAHASLERALDGKRLPYSSATAGVTTITAANTTLSMQDLEDIINAAKAANHEVVFTAGALKIRPTNSAL